MSTILLLNRLRFLHETLYKYIRRCAEKRNSNLSFNFDVVISCSLHVSFTRITFDLCAKSWKEKLKFFSKKHWSYWPSGHTTSKQRRFNVDSMSWRSFNVESMLFQRYVPAGWYSSCEHLHTNKPKTKLADLSSQRQQALLCLDSQGSYTGPLWSSFLLIWCKYSCYWQTFIQCNATSTTNIPNGRICPHQRSSC